jgi:membrane protease YdiL (CAAX protease family)
MHITVPQDPAKERPFMDPLSIFLFVVALLLTWAQIQTRTTSPSNIVQAGLEARIVEMHWTLGEASGKKIDIYPKLQKNQWNTAVEIMLLSEQGQIEKAQEHLHLTPEEAFQVCWEAAYNSGPLPSEQEIAQAMSGLGGLAGKYLEASLLEASHSQGGNDGQTETNTAGIRSQAFEQHLTKAMALAVLMISLIGGAVAGIAIGIWMLTKPKPIPEAPQFQMPTTYIIRVCLGWYLALLTSGTIITLINEAIPMGAWRFPAVYAFHAACGIAFICAAEKISPAALWKKISQANLSWIHKGIQFLLLALGSVLLLALILSLFMPEGEPPQKELMEIIHTTKGVLPFILIFGTVALLGPVFEEIFFRGFLLSVLRRRLSVFWALALSSLLFGAIHFQLTGLPVLALLGAALGLAFIMTRDIKTAIFVHACWNGGVFLFQKLLLG